MAPRPAATLAALILASTWCARPARRARPPSETEEGRDLGARWVDATLLCRRVSLLHGRFEALPEVDSTALSSQRERLLNRIGDIKGGGHSPAVVTRPLGGDADAPRRRRRPPAGAMRAGRISARLVYGAVSDAERVLRRAIRSLVAAGRPRRAGASLLAVGSGRSWHVPAPVADSAPAADSSPVVVSALNGSAAVVGGGDSDGGAGPDGGDAAEDEDLDDDCAICFHTIQDPEVLLCNHSYCRGCVNLWLQQSDLCPKCRTVVRAQPRLRLKAALQRLGSVVFSASQVALVLSQAYVLRSVWRCLALAHRYAALYDSCPLRDNIIIQYVLNAVILAVQALSLYMSWRTLQQLA